MSLMNALSTNFQRRWTVAPGNNEILVVWDSSRALWLGNPNGMSDVAVAAGSAFLIPGPLVGAWGRVVIAGSVNCTGQNVTLKWYRRTEFDGDANDWQLDDGTTYSAPTATATQVVTAGVANEYHFEWTPTSPEHLVRIDAGATGPTTLVVQLNVSVFQERGV